MSKLFFALIFAATSAFAEVPNSPIDELRLDLRFEQSPSFDDKLDETAQYRRRFQPWLEVEGALRMSQTLLKLQGVQYKLQADFPLLSFFSLSARLTQSSFISPGFSTTHAAFLGNFDVPIFSGWHFLLSGGYYFRFIHLQNALPIPFFDSSFSERHWMALIGTWVGLSDHFKLYGWMATYESLDIFNFNNPYGSLSLHYKPTNGWEYMAYARHRILLGFGRRDALLVGVGMTIPIEPLFDRT